MKFINLFFLTFCLFSFGCYRTQTANDQVAEETQTDITPRQSSERNIDFPETPIELPEAIHLSTLPQDVALSQKIEETIEQSHFKNAHWGVFVVSLKDGRVIAARNAQKNFNPASTQKLFTTAVALDRLGADFRWRTSVFAAREIDADGTLNADIFLYGRGAPDFDEQDLANLVEQLKQKGLRRVTGNVVGDASFFHADNLGDGWTWNEAQWYYGAEPSALSYSDNTVLVEIIPPEIFDEPITVKTTPEASFVKVTVNAKASDRATTGTVGVRRRLDANEYQVWGEVPRGKSFGIRTTMHAPQLWAANDFKKALERAGIAVAGIARGADARTSNVQTENLKELAAVESEPLSEIIKRTNKRSINLNAELMLRTLGQSARKQIENQNQKPTMLSDDALGSMAIKKWLAEKRVATGETEIHDGSGLSRLNFVSPETLGRLLVFAAQMRHADAFKNSLPIAGTDGTLGGRLAKFKDKIFAKTGTITYVNALSGYAQIADDETVAFVIFCNNETSQQNSVGTVDAIASLIAAGNETENKEVKTEDEQ